MPSIVLTAGESHAAGQTKIALSMAPECLRMWSCTPPLLVLPSLRPDSHDELNISSGGSSGCKGCACSAFRYECLLPMLRSSRRWQKFKRRPCVSKARVSLACAAVMQMTAWVAMPRIRDCSHVRSSMQVRTTRASRALQGAIKSTFQSDYADPASLSSGAL